MTTATAEVSNVPDMKVSIRQVFGIDSDMEVPAFSEPDEHVPEIDHDYRFDRTTTLAVVAGFAKNRRVIVTGYPPNFDLGPYGEPIFASHPGSSSTMRLEEEIIDPLIYSEMVRSTDEGVAEFLDLARVKPNTLGNSRMLKLL